MDFTQYGRRKAGYSLAGCDKGAANQAEGGCSCPSEQQVDTGALFARKQGYKNQEVPFSQEASISFGLVGITNVLVPLVLLVPV